jgi:hypothetical protein
MGDVLHVENATQNANLCRGCRGAEATESTARKPRQKTLGQLEAETTALGIHMVTLSRLDRVWVAFVFGEYPTLGGEPVLGEGADVESAYLDAIANYRAKLTATL